jgi:hypothetical protein
LFEFENDFAKITILQLFSCYLFEEDAEKTGFGHFPRKTKNPPADCRRVLGAAEEIRTPMPLRALPPQSSASTSSATAALDLQR